MMLLIEVRKKWTRLGFEKNQVNEWLGFDVEFLYDMLKLVRDL